MRNFIKYAAVGIAGYFIGFYEMKYKIVKCIAEGKIGIEKEEDSE